LHGSETTCWAVYFVFTSRKLSASVSNWAPPRAVEKKDCPMSFEDFAGATANDILIDTAWKCRVCQLLPALHLRKACVDTSYANAVTGVLQGVELQPMGIPMGMNINIVGLNTVVAPQTPWVCTTCHSSNDFALGECSACFAPRQPYFWVGPQSDSVYFTTLYCTYT